MASADKTRIQINGFLKNRKFVLGNIKKTEN
jgi:hypothetical protein